MAYSYTITRVSKVLIFVLTINPNFAETQLFRFLSSISHSELIVVSGFTPQELGCDAECPGHGLGGRLTCIEFAVAEGHRMARNIARKNTGSVYLFLEDDAIPNVDSSEFNIVLEEFNKAASLYQVPALHLFPEQNGILKSLKKSHLCKVYHLPDYALAYALTEVSLATTSNHDIDKSSSVADWPPHIRKLNWLSTKDSMFIHPDIHLVDASSSTRDSRIARMNKESQLQKALNPRSYLRLLLPFLRHWRLGIGSSPIETESLRSVLFK
jgi:hypothetical protein